MNLSPVKSWATGETLTASDLNAEYLNIYNHTITNADMNQASNYIFALVTANAGAEVKNGSTSAGFLKLYENSSNGSNAVTLIGPSSTADVTLTLPASTDTLVGKATTDTLTNKTLASAVLDTGVSGTAVLDEDNMASDSATKLATQQSIKAYVDSSGSGTIGGTLGSTDNAVPRANGTGAATLQASSVLIDDSNSITGVVNLTASGELDGATLDISGDADIDGQTNLDTVDIDGAVQIDATVTVGVDDTGYDVKFFGATSGSSVLFDESADDMILTNYGLAVGSDATGDLYYRNSSGFLARLGKGTSGHFLKQGSSIPEWSAVSGTGVGDFSGPGSSTSNAVVRFSGTGGKTGLNSGVIIDDSNNISGVGTLGIAGGSSNGVVISQGDIAIKNGGTQSTIKFYCESSNAHYAQIQAPAHSAFSGNVTLTLPASSDTLIGKATTDTLTNKTWNGAVIASAYLDADTAHLSGNQTFTGNKTFTGTLTTGVDDTGVDVKFFGASAGAYVEWDQSEDQLRIMGASADATTSTGKLLLATSNPTINANDVLGKIDFQAPHETGTDAITVSASIQAIAQSTFSASSNATDLIFYTGHSEVATEKFRITSQGELGIGGANYGSDGQVLTSTGAGSAPAWENASGAYSSWAIKTTTYTASSGDQLIGNHPSTGFTITLPSSPTGGDTVTIKNAGASLITVGRNSEKINSIAEDGSLLENASVQLVYVDSTIGWVSL